MARTIRFAFGPQLARLLDPTTEGQPMRAKKVQFVSNGTKTVHLHSVRQSDLIASKNRELTFLVSEIRHFKGDLRYRDMVIREVVDLLESGLDYGDWPTLGQVITVINRLKYAVRGKG